MKYIPPLLAYYLLAILFSAVPATHATPEEDLLRFPECRHCRMAREQYAQSRMFITYNDGSQSGFCSIHCLAVDLVLNTDKTPESIRVGDYATKVLIDAETASWVLGGLKRGVMTERAKWDFGTVKDAEAFIKENGGEIVVFEQALEGAYYDMYSDSKLIRNTRKLRMIIHDFEKRTPTGSKPPLN